MFNYKLKELKERQAEITDKIQQYTQADENYYITASTILNLAQRALEVFKNSEVLEKRQLLNFLLQNPVLQGKNLVFTLKTPFDRVLEASRCVEMLRGEDSNLQPTRYTNPQVSLKRGLYHPPSSGGGGQGAVSL